MDSCLRSIASILPVDKREIAVEATYEIGNTLLATLVLIAICEVASHKTVRDLRKTKEGALLHTSGFVSTIFNFIFLAVPVQVTARLYVQLVGVFSLRFAHTKVS
jgi:large-conductance mechanosensitive channel